MKAVPTLDFAALAQALAAPEMRAAPQRELTPEHRRALSKVKAVGQSRRDLTAEAIAAVDGERNLEAAKLALKALDQDPESLGAYLAGAVALDRLGYLVEALAFYEQAVMRSPSDPVIAALLGNTALRANELEVAEGFYRVAAQLAPEDHAHISNLAGVLRDQGRFEEAIEVLRNRLYMQPAEAELWNTLGTVLQEQGAPDQAVTFLAEAVRLKPDFGRAHHNYGTTLTDLGRYEESGAALDCALANARSRADEAEMRHARAHARLGAGRLAEGWDDYEARLDPLVHEALMFQIPRPRWAGEDLAGKRLMVIGEQGLGDEVLFMNAARDAIEALGPEGKLIVACQKRLVPLFARSFPRAQVMMHASGRLGSHTVRLAHDFHDWEGVDFWAPMGQLAAVLRRDLSAFPQGPYLTPDPARVAAFKAQLAGLGPGLNVGLAWKSLVMSPKRRRYFAPFEAFGALARVPGVNFINMQYGDTAEEEAFARDRWGISLKRIEGLDVRDDLDGVAAAGLALDLMISPMNASSNLAASCGGKVWFYERIGTWVNLGTDGKPWYTSSRTFRCAEDEDWTHVFARMQQHLAALAPPGDSQGARATAA